MTTREDHAVPTPPGGSVDTLPPPPESPSTWSWPQTSQTASNPPPAGAGSPRLGWRQYLAVAAVSATAAAAVAVPVSMDDGAPSQAAAAPPAPAEASASLPQGDDGAIADIAAQVTPSVVRVDAASNAGAGACSGVVYRADGHIVTNNHVVASAAEVSVTLPDGEQYEAEVVGTDPVSDLAVLKVDATGLPVPAFATESPAIGSTAVAIGSPFGLDGSVTSGIISALNRTVTAQGAPLVDLVQTDAAINPGNSGGALVNDRGELLGLNTVIASTSGGSVGIGFAIPVSTVQSVADQLIDTGTVAHAYLGVRGDTVDPRVAEMYRLGAEQGAVIGSIEPGGPAAEAGLQQGDIVTAVGDQQVTSFPEFAAMIQGETVGQTVTLTLVRGDEELQVDVTLAERPTPQ